MKNLSVKAPPFPLFSLLPNSNCPMDKLIQYRKIIKQLLEDYVNFVTQDPVVETQFVFDEEIDHYQLVLAK
jgi:hypothetical protein